MSEISARVERRRTSDRSSLRKLGIGVCLAVAGITATDAKIPSHPPTRPVEAAAPLFPASCDSPPRETLAMVAELFDSRYKSLEQLDGAEVADEYGLTVHDGGHFIETRLRGHPTSTPAEVANYITTANRFLDLYDVKLKVSSPGYDSFGWKKPTLKQFQSPVVHQNIENIIYGIGTLPVEYVHLSGLKRIILLSNRAKKVEPAYAEMASGDTIVYNITSPSAPDVAAHEVYHLIDSQQCGAGAENDPGYEALNGRNIYKTGKRIGAISLLDSYYGPSYTHRYKKLQAAAKKRDETQYCRLKEIEEKEAAQVVAVSDYSFTHVVEDKAEMGRLFSFPYKFGVYFNEYHPILRSKFQFLMARLYESSPGIVKYFAAVGGSYNSEKETYHCE